MKITFIHREKMNIKDKKVYCKTKLLKQCLIHNKFNFIIK